MSESSMNFDLLAQATEQLRELTSAVVAGFIADGFTDREARRLTVHFLAPLPTEDTE